MGTESYLTPMYAGRKGPWADEGKSESMNMDNYGALKVVGQGGKYMEWVRRGYVFSAEVPTAATLLATATTGNFPAIWNTQSSGKIVVPMFLRINKHTPGTAASGGIVLAALSAGDIVTATTGVVCTWTNVAPSPMLIGSATAAVTKFSPAVNTYVAAPAIFMDTGFSYNMSTAVANDSAMFNLDFDGSVIMKPGTVMAVCGKPVSVATYTLSIVFAEIPYDNYVLP
jgi:hypothetical protein